MVEGTVYTTVLPDSSVRVYLIDGADYFDRPQLYGEDGADYPDNCERFVFFDRAVLETIRLLGLRFDVLHCNDWQTGLIPVYLEEHYRRRPEFAAVGTLLTIHNLAYQGSFWHWDMPLTGLDWRLFNWRQLEFHGRLNFLKAGLVFADLLSTVSPTYAREIQTPALGCGLDGLLRSRQHDLHGIVNGIDLSVWSPSVEPMLAARLRRRDGRGGQGGLQGRLAAPRGPARTPRRPAPGPDRPARPAERLGPAGRSGR